MERDREREIEAMATGNKLIVLITGCAKGGIGYEYCKAFTSHGCHVIPSDLPHLLPSLPSTIPLDVSSDSSVASAVSTLLSLHGRIDILINNAGIPSTGPLAELPLPSIRRAFEVNTLGPLRLIQAVAPHMAARRSGRIVNVGSVVGTAATPWAGSYCATKAAVHAMSDALRLELRPFGVHVVTVVPGAVRSNFGREGGETREWVMYERFAAAIRERAAASQGGAAGDAAAMARVVAGRVLRARPPRRIVFGGMTGMFRVLTWSPMWVRNMFFAKRFGLDKML